MEQAGLAKSFGPIIAPQNHLPDSSDREEDFDVLGPTSWPVESCFPMGVKVSSSTHGTLLALRHTRCIVVNAFFLGITQIASVYGTCIQWCLYEVARIWKLKVPLEIWRNLFYLTFLLWTLCAVSSPKFHLLHKAPWEDHLSHPLALELCRSSKFFSLSLNKKDAAWIMGVAAEAKRAEAKDPPILQPDKKEHSPPSTRDRS